MLSNDPTYLSGLVDGIVCCDIHTRFRTQKKMKDAGMTAIRLDEIMTESIEGSGYNKEYGLLGSNKAGEDKVKLFPKDTDEFVERLADKLNKETGKRIEVLVYGDGAFKDPVGGIWELADPVVSPSYTSGLEGTPNEIKMKYFADTDFKDLSGDELDAALRNRIREKTGDLKGQMQAQGTTPRRFTDLVGSLCDLTSGSGDRGTPVVLVQNYFTNYATN